MKKLLSIFVFVFTTLIGFGQLNINSMLINACGDENFSELVEFTTTNGSIDISNLTGDYTVSNGGTISSTPSWAPTINGTTGAKVAAINAKITGCGIVLEPPSGIIPPNSKVFFIRSEQMNPDDHDYSSLDDTLYMIFNTADPAPSAVFAHTFNSGTDRERGFNIKISGVLADSVRYKTLSLTSFATGGTSSTDGDRANFPDTWANINQTTYTNTGCDAFPAIAVTVNVSNPSDTNVCIGQAPINLVGDPQNTNLNNWLPVSNGTLTPSGNTATYDPSGATPGDVLVIYTGGLNCANGVQDTVTIHVLNPPVQPTITSTNNLFCTSVGTLPITADSAGTWAETSNSGATITSGQGTNSITVNGAGTYTITVADPNSCGGNLTSSNFVVTAGTDPDSTILSISDNDICFGTGATDTIVTLTAQKNPTSTTTSIAYWTVDGSRNETHPLVLRTDAGTGSFSITLTDSTECGTLTSTTKSINKHPQIGTGNDTISITTSTGDSSICNTPGASLNLTASLTNITFGTNFNWVAASGTALTPSGTANNTIAANESTTYTVSYTDPFGCGSDNEAISITVEEPPSITITTPDTILCADNDVPIAFTATNGINITWHRTDTTTANIIQAAEKAPGTSPFILSSGSNGVSNSQGATETIIVVNSSSTCPNDSDMITVSILPSFNTTPTLTADDTVCANLTDTIQLYAPGINNALLTNTLVWTGPDTSLIKEIARNGADYQYYSIPGFASQASYTVTITNQCATNKLSNTEIIEPGQAPSGVVLTTPDTLGCLFEDFILNVAAEGTQPITYTWFKNSADIQVLDNSLTQIIDRPTIAGDFTYYVEAANACNTGGLRSDTDKVTIRQLPDFEVIIPNLAAGGDSSLCVNGTVTLVVSSTEAIEHDSTFWSTGYKGQNPITVAKAGIYKATVYDTTTAHRCSNTKDITIEICPALIYAPTAFTPNGDGINDQFFMVGVAVLDIGFTVYDRWGIQVFKTEHDASSVSGISDPWDGNDSSGNPAQTGAYIWYAQFFGDFDNSGINYGTRMGTVVLTR